MGVLKTDVCVSKKISNQATTGLTKKPAFFQFKVRLDEIAIFSQFVLGDFFIAFGNSPLLGVHPDSRLVWEYLKKVKW
jgi:hypothetical protein